MFPFLLCMKEPCPGGKSSSYYAENLSSNPAACMRHDVQEHVSGGLPEAGGTPNGGG